MNPTQLFITIVYSALEIELDEQRVLSAIVKGGTGAGTMPPGLLSGDEAQQVAAFVAQARAGG